MKDLEPAAYHRPRVGGIHHGDISFDNPNPVGILNGLIRLCRYNTESFICVLAYHDSEISPSQKVGT